MKYIHKTATSLNVWSENTTQDAVFTRGSCVWLCFQVRAAIEAAAA